MAKDKEVQKRDAEAKQAAADEAAAARHQSEGREKARDRVDKPAAKQEKGEPVGRDTPSALALAEVGNVDGESVDPDKPEPYDAEAVNAHGEAYQAAKRKHRWG